MHRSPKVQTAQTESDALGLLQHHAKELKQATQEKKVEEVIRWFSATFHIATAALVHWFFSEQLCMPREMSVFVSVLSNGSIYSDRVHGFLETIRECREKIAHNRERIAELFEAHPTSLPLFRSTLVSHGFDPHELEPSGLLQGLDEAIEYKEE